MTLLQVLLLLSTFLRSLVSGLLLTFAVVVMPGIRALNDRDFIRAFQVMDRVIQNNQPLFMAAWAGSVIALLASAALGVPQTDGTSRLLMIVAVIVYLLGVQLPTVAINVPLNNEVQSLEIDTMSPSALGAARERFETRWTRWNSIRTVLAGLVSVLLILVVRGL